MSIWHKIFFFPFKISGEGIFAFFPDGINKEGYLIPAGAKKRIDHFLSLAIYGFIPVLVFFVNKMQIEHLPWEIRIGLFLSILLIYGLWYLSVINRLKNNLRDINAETINAIDDQNYYGYRGAFNIIILFLLVLFCGIIDIALIESQMLGLKIIGISIIAVYILLVIIEMIRMLFWRFA